MAEARDAAAAVQGLVALARSMDGGDPLRDEPASVFRPLEPTQPAAGAAQATERADRGR